MSNLRPYPGWKGFTFLAGEFPEPTLAHAEEYRIESPIRWVATPDNHLNFVSPDYAAEHEERWKKIVNANIEHIASSYSYSLSRFQDVFAGKTAIICGSGPSLEKNIDLINKVSKSRHKEFVVISINSSIGLLNAPTVYVFSERDYDMKLWKFDPKQLRCHMLVAYMFSHTSCFTDINYDILGLVNQGVADRLPEYCRELWRKNYDRGLPLQELPHMQETATLALWVAFWLGCRKWLLTGMDYSFTDKYYAGVKPDQFDDSELAGRFHYRGYVPYKVPDINGNKVRTTAMMERNAWLQSIACLQYAQDGGCKIYNCSEGGILRHGMSGVMTLKEGLEC